MDNQYVESRTSRHLHARASKAGIPLSGTFELTPCCNLSCKMCYVRKDKAAVEAEGGLLRAEEWISLAKECKEAGMLYLLLTGGEPLTHPDFKEIYTAVRNMGMVVNINTNGILMDDDMVAFLAENPPARVNISLYGSSRATYENLCGVPDAYNKALAGIRRLQDAGILVKLNCSVTPQNRADMNGILAMGKKLGCNVQVATYMFPPLRRDGTKVGVNNRLTPKEDALSWLESEHFHMTEEEYIARCKARLDRTADEPMQDCLDAPTEPIRCRAGSSAFWVSWNGDVSLCGMIPLVSANIRNVSFRDAWAAVRADTKELRMPPKCTACPDRNVCMVCAAAVYCETGHFGTDVPDYLCQRTKALLEESKRICNAGEETK